MEAESRLGLGVPAVAGRLPGIRRECDFTAPNSWCPHPERWTTADQESAENEVIALVTGFVYAIQPDCVVETGTATGATAHEIGRALKANGHGKLWTIELDTELACKAAKRFTLSELPINVVNRNSLHWMPPNMIDFAWIDSGPAETRAAEIRRWRHWFRPGAIIGVHDTAPNNGRQVTAGMIAQIIDDFHWNPISLRTPRGVTFLQVTA